MVESIDALLANWHFDREELEAIPSRGYWYSAIFLVGVTTKVFVVLTIISAYQ